LISPNTHALGLALEGAFGASDIFPTSRAYGELGSFLVNVFPFSAITETDRVLRVEDSIGLKEGRGG